MNAVLCTWLFIRELKAVVGPYRVPIGNLCKIKTVHTFQQGVGGAPEAPTLPEKRVVIKRVRNFLLGV